MNANIPAFPGVQFNDGQPKCSDPGMTLRDYFAAKALAGMCSGEPGPHLVPPNAAKLAYEYADAMLAARSKP